MRLNFSISSSDKPSPKILWPFLAVHGFLFLGIDYILFPTFQIFILIHALIGIFIYLVFWRAFFPNFFKDVLIGAGISVIMGMLFGDILIDKFFFLYQEAPKGFVPKIYSSLVIFYLYFYIALIKRAVIYKK